MVPQSSTGLIPRFTSSIDMSHTAPIPTGSSSADNVHFSIYSCNPHGLRQRQHGHHSPQGWGTTPFVFNESDHQVSLAVDRCDMC